MEVESGMDGSQQRFIIERFFEKIDSSELHGFHSKADLSVAGHDDYRQTSL
jgi:hypothetical protein